MSDELPLPDLTSSHAGRERAVDSLTLLLAVILGALFLSPQLHDTPDPLSAQQVAVDIGAGALACASLWWRRRWPVGVAIACLLLGTVSSSATPAGLLALSSLAVHRPARPTVLVTALWVPSVLVFAVYSPTTDPASVVLFVMPLALAASGWGMFIRARRQLLLSLRERALRAEADQELRKEQAQVAERTRIAREMHDVLAHRISLLALHAGALEVRPDLPPDQVRASAALLRATARQALEELRGVIGVLRDTTAKEPAPAAPQPALRDLGRLVEEARAAGTETDLDLHVEHIDEAPASLGRDAYRIVQEALTNVGKHAPGAVARVRVSGGPGVGLHVSIHSRRPARALTTATLPGAGAGMLGLRERVTLAGGTLVTPPRRETGRAGGPVPDRPGVWLQTGRWSRRPPSLVEQVGQQPAGDESQPARLRGQAPRAAGPGPDSRSDPTRRGRQVRRHELAKTSHLCAGTRSATGVEAYQAGATFAMAVCRRRRRKQRRTPPERRPGQLDCSRGPSS